MLTSVEGVYRHGKIELGKLPTHVRDETRVIVTFLEPGPIDLRARLASFAEEWDSPEMDVYDDYDAAKANRPRHDWDKQFRAMAECGDDQLLDEVA